jgi:hypothetical protein
MGAPDTDPPTRDLFEVTRDPMLVHDPADARILDANDAASRLLGYDRSVLVGSRLDAFRIDEVTAGSTGREDEEQARDRGSERGGRKTQRSLEEAVENGEARFECKLERSDGTRCAVDVFVTRAQVDRAERLVSVLRDETEVGDLSSPHGTEGQETRDGSRGCYGTKGEFDDATLSDGGRREKISSMLETGRTFFDVEYAYLTTLEDDSRTVTQTVGGHEALQAGSSIPLAESYSQYVHGADEAGVGCVLDAAGTVGDSTADERFGFECFVGMEVVVDGEVTGAVCFADDEPCDREFSQRDRTFLETIAGWVARS